MNALAAAPDLSRAVAHQKLGDIFRQIGRTGEALRQYEFARDLALTLAAGSPKDPAIGECLARSYAGLAELCLNADRPRDAIDHCLQVVRLTEQNAGLIENQGRARATLLEAYFRLGRAYGFERDLEQAEVWFRKMEALAER